VFPSFSIFCIFVIYKLWNHDSIRQQKNALSVLNVVKSIFSEDPIDDQIRWTGDSASSPKSFTQEEKDDNHFSPDFTIQQHSRKYYLVQLARVLLMLLGNAIYL
jgi:hypothetical protein